MMSESLQDETAIVAPTIGRWGPVETLAGVLPVTAVIAIAFACFVLDQVLLFVGWKLNGVVEALSLASVVGVLIPGALACRFFDLPVWGGLRLTRPRAADCLLALGLVGSALAPIYALGVITQRLWPPTEEAFALYEALLPHGVGSLLLGGLGVGVVAPLAEEVVFRTLLLFALVRVVPGPLAIGIQAGLFALSHGAVWMFPPITVFGVLLGMLVHRRGSITPAWIAHGVFNLVAYADLCWTHDVRGIRLEHWACKPWVVGPSVLALGVVIGLLYRKPRTLVGTLPTSTIGSANDQC
jgi:membrane protease YdiL (CAAX protease family)